VRVPTGGVRGRNPYAADVEAYCGGCVPFYDI
jgi:hypothetical protein